MFFNTHNVSDASESKELATRILNITTVCHHGGPQWDSFPCKAEQPLQGMELERTYS